MSDAVMSIAEHVAYVRDLADVGDGAGTAAQALRCVSHLCDLVARLNHRIIDLEAAVEEADNRADGIAHSIKLAVEDHVRQEWHR